MKAKRLTEEQIIAVLKEAEAGGENQGSRPGKPIENTYIESFNGRFRDECLNEHWFLTMPHALRVIEHWRIERLRLRASRIRDCDGLSTRSGEVPMRCSPF